MTTNILYIAASLDGYIARLDGAIDWLSGVEQEGEDYGYGAFYDTLDALIMGRKTYDQVLRFEQWPYDGKQSLVLTRQTLSSDRADVTFVADDLGLVLQRLEAQGMSRIWLVGGGELVRTCLQQRWMDECIIAMIPVLLGGGIPLFPTPFPETHLDLVSATPYPTGLVQVHYRVKR